MFQQKGALFPKIKPMLFLEGIKCSYSSRKYLSMGNCHSIGIPHMILFAKRILNVGLVLASSERTKLFEFIFHT